MTELEDILKDLRINQDCLDVACPYGLQNYFSGWNSSTLTLMLWRHVDQSLKGVSSEGLASKICFMENNRMDAFQKLLELLISRLDDVSFEFEVCEYISFIDLVEEILLGGRTGMLFNPSTYTAFFQFWSGYLAGLRCHNPTRYAEEFKKMEMFESYLQEKCGIQARWYIILRTFHPGEFEKGFLKIWYECFEGSNK